MRRALPSIGLAAALALVSWATGCADPLEQSAAPAPFTVELLTVEQGLHHATATYRVRNDGDRALAYEGSFGAGVPVSRLAILSEGKWVEQTPAWVKCATGRSYFTLEPGTEATLEVRVQRPDLPMRVGVGTWEPVDGATPYWMDWNWTWSSAVVVDDRLYPSGS